MTRKNLPRIACFHGGGSRSAIHKIQCSALISALEHDFQLEFFEGPFDRAAGPGILPAFTGYEPYKSWFKKDETGKEFSDGGGYDTLGRSGIERMWKVLEEHRGGQGGEWVGVMGFSQGTRMAGGLLLDQQRRENQGLPPAVASIRLRFGVICMGWGSPMEAEVGSYRTDQDDGVICVPTLHMHGLKDEFLPFGRLQKKTFYDPRTASLFEADCPHAMPRAGKDCEELAHRIRALYRTTRGNL